MKLSIKYSALPISLLVSFGMYSSSAVAHDSAEATYGEVDFPISCNDDVQTHFNQGLALLHNMMYVQAAGVFNDAAESAPDCAMLHWGIAMSNFHPLWAGMQSEAEFERGSAAIQKALELSTELGTEKDFINAANAFYSTDFSAKKGDRLNAWSDQQHELYKSYPDNLKATSFYALSHLATADRSDKTYAHQKAAGQLMEDLHAKAPSHPAGFHYVIHAYDNPALAAQAEQASRTYDSIAPEVPHALHMPSHIFVRMGLWDETIYWNKRAAAAAIDQSTEKVTSQGFAHAMDYLVYAQLQQGKIEEATNSLQELYDVDNHQDSFASAYALTASAARIPLEQSDWSAATKLLVNEKENISWDKFKYAEPMTHFARGIGGARGDDLELAGNSIAELERLHKELQEAQRGYWATLTESMVHSVKAWKAFAEDDLSAAIDLMGKAADIEDSVDKAPVTPGAVLPARELYGDMLQLMDKPAEALVAYEAALSVSPGRARSLRGAAQSAEKSGNIDKANEYKAYMLSMSESG